MGRCSHPHSAHVTTLFCVVDDTADGACSAIEAKSTLGNSCNKSGYSLAHSKSLAHILTLNICETIKDTKLTKHLINNLTKYKKLDVINFKMAQLLSC